jgi:hypothetical protein
MPTMQETIDRLIGEMRDLLPAFMQAVELSANSRGKSAAELKAALSAIDAAEAKLQELRQAILSIPKGQWEASLAQLPPEVRASVLDNLGLPDDGDRP